MFVFLRSWLLCRFLHLGKRSGALPGYYRAYLHLNSRDGQLSWNRQRARDEYQISYLSLNTIICKHLIFNTLIFFTCCYQIWNTTISVMLTHWCLGQWCLQVLHLNHRSNSCPTAPYIVRGLAEVYLLPLLSVSFQRLHSHTQRGEGKVSVWGWDCTIISKQRGEQKDKV